MVRADPPPILAILVSGVLALAAVPQVAEPLFIDAGFDLGSHLNGRTGELDMAEMISAGVAFFDLENDGDLDLLLTDGGRLGDRPYVDPKTPLAGPRLWRNDLAVDGKLQFKDVTATSGLKPSGYGLGVAIGDIDNDGFADLYLTNIGPNALWRNRGDGTFEHRSVGVEDPGYSSGAVFLDFDRDGWLDLFVINYLEDRLDRPRACFSPASRRDYCGPRAYPAQKNRLFKNFGHGRFEDVTLKALPGEKPLPSLGVQAFDADSDGWLDVFVANDGEPSQLWRNRGDGTFEELAALTGLALDAQGLAGAGMGVAIADVDGDLDEDVFVTHLRGETNALWFNHGGLFEDLTQRTGLGPPSLPMTGFGAAFFDLENDGDLDLVTVNGAVRLVDEQIGSEFPLVEPAQLFRNESGRFALVDPAAAGASFARPEVGRGLAKGDVDNDGDIDFLVGNNGGTFRLLLNVSRPRGRWLGLRLVANGRDALGARVRLVGAKPLMARVATGGSYGSAHDPRLLFGLGAAPTLEAIEVVWPDGRQELFPVPALDRYSTLSQGQASLKEKR
jgi:enediyne biosynthesis protein E4